jgi:hypothetical protein
LLLLFSGENEVIFLKNLTSLYRQILFSTPQQQTTDFTTKPNPSLSQTVESRSSKAGKSFFNFPSPCPENTDTQQKISLEWGDNAEVHSSSFHPRNPHAQLYQDIACHTTVEITGFLKIGLISIKKAYVYRK